MLLLDDGRRLEHPAQVERGDVLDLDGGVCFATAAARGTRRETGEPVVLASAVRVRP